MAFQIADWFGFDANDRSVSAEAARRGRLCPFIQSKCTKLLHDGSPSGVCSALVGKGLPSPPVIICPNRLYADDYAVLSHIARLAFGDDVTVISPTQRASVRHDGKQVVVFGHGFGREIKLPGRRIGQKYSIDWILARISEEGKLAEFTAMEAQTIDTTGNYRAQLLDLQSGKGPTSKATAGLNWENVNKRILPQLIYKGHALRQEQMCPKGLFFVCPGAIYRRVIDRLGGDLREYSPQHGSITFVYYSLGDSRDGVRPLVLEGSFTTTVDQVALAFTSPTNLPPSGAYRAAIEQALA
jgi:hypothetical protein